MTALVASSAFAGWPLLAAAAITGYTLWWLARYHGGGR